MPESLTVVTPPAVTPVTLAEAKAQLRVTVATEDTLITRLINVATDYVERDTGRALITQVWKLSLTRFPLGRVIGIPKPPLQSVASVKYTPDGGTLTTFAASNYLVDTDAEPGAVVLNVNKTWPSDTLQAANGVEIEFTAGYGAAETDVDEAARHAELMMLSHLYEHREAVLVGPTAIALPLGVRALLIPLCVWRA